MKIERIIEILEKHQEWRRDQNVPPKTQMQSPIELGTAIDYAIEELKKLPQREMKTETLTTINTPNYVGGYRLGTDHYFQFNLTYKPNWFHRTMMRLCFGYKWINL
jgi:hypothetical protein